MNQIDPRTVIVLTGVMSGLMSLVLYSLQRNYPPTIKGLREWSAGLLILFIAGAMTALRGHVHDGISITLANFLLMAGLYVGYMGTQRFFGVRPRPWPWMLVILIVMAAQIWFTHQEPNYYVRLLMVNVVAGSLFGAHALLVSRQGLVSFAKALTFGVLVFMALIQALRMLAVYFWPVNNGLLDTAPHHVAYVTSFAFSTLLFSIGLVLMASDQLRAEFEHLATHDSLTNALTRRHMNQLCQRELERVRRTGRTMAMLLIDLDHFKAINDTFGHQMGDRVLVEFVAKVRALLRQPDQLGRYGGEEFLVLLPETSLDEALTVANRILQACALPDQGSTPAYTASIGVATNRADADEVDAMLARADAALYRAKGKGRNRVEVSP